MKRMDLPPGMTPRCISRPEAAAYCGLSVNSFNSAVSRGELPAPLKFGRRAVWDVKAIDQALDHRSGVSERGESIGLTQQQRDAAELDAAFGLTQPAGRENLRRRLNGR